jgi:hypothetical protein
MERAHTSPFEVRSSGYCRIFEQAKIGNFGEGKMGGNILVITIFKSPLFAFEVRRNKSIFISILKHPITSLGKNRKRAYIRNSS